MFLIFCEKDFLGLRLSQYVCRRKQTYVPGKHNCMMMTQRENDSPIYPALIHWYELYKRDLPWRESKDPYIIWISEIILQQTRVVQGLDYFLRFTKRFPDVKSLGEAAEDEVLKLWQGLGYYSRARNLQAAARDILERFDGRFPSDYKEVLSLKGIGEYTAAAIVSFAWDQPYPVVDGNVYRVLSRLFAIDIPIDSTQGKKLFYQLAGEVMDKRRAGLYNQAVMEFGALQCVPQQPDCVACPLVSSCVAYATGNVTAFPVKKHKTKTRNRYFHYVYIIYKGQTWLHRRSGKDIWTGLYEFPLIETAEPMDFTVLQQTDAFHSLFAGAGDLRIKGYTEEVKHVLSHQILYARFYRIEVEHIPPALEAFIPIEQAALATYPVPVLIHKVLDKNGF